MKPISNAGFLKERIGELGEILKNPKEILRYRLLKHTSVLLSGDAGARVISLVSLTLTIRAIGPELFGVLAIAETYAKLVDRIFNFQAWTGIIRFGAEALHNKNKKALRRYILVGFSLDLLSSFVGFIVAFFLAPFVAGFFKWDEAILNAIKFYSFLALFNFTGTATGILRLTERFSLLAWQRIFYACLKLGAVTLVWLFNGDFHHFLFVWLVSEILGYMFIVLSSLAIVFRKKWLRIEDSSDVSRFEAPLKPFIVFVVWTNLSSTLDIPTKFLDMFIVSSLVSVEAAGVYKVFQQIGHVLKKPMEPLYQVIYPYFSNDVARGLHQVAIVNALRSLIFTIPVIGVILAVSVGLSPWWLPAIFGKKFAEVIPEFAVYMIITGLAVVLNNINPLFVALGFVRENFFIQAVSNSLFLILAWLAAGVWDLRGVFIAYGVHIVVSYFAKIVLIGKHYGWRSLVGHSGKEE
ncbi:MAG: lipopolysaccharide biosynthesis protein [Thermodesulforhabdaceae bacterium]